MTMSMTKNVVRCSKERPFNVHPAGFSRSGKQPASPHGPTNAAGPCHSKFSKNANASIVPTPPVETRAGMVRQRVSQRDCSHAPAPQGSPYKSASKTRECGYQKYRPLLFAKANSESRSLPEPTPAQRQDQPGDSRTPVFILVQSKLIDAPRLPQAAQAHQPPRPGAKQVGVIL